MSYILVLLVVVASFILSYISDKVNGQYYTEAEAIGGAAYFLTRSAKASSILTKFLLLLLLTHPVFLAISIEGFIGSIITGIGAFALFFVGIWWITFVLPVFFIITGFVVTGIVTSYSKKRFDSTKPDYDNWKEFQDGADRERRTTNVWIGGNSWSPIHSGTKPSLSARASSRSSGSSNNSVRHSGFILPISSRSSPFTSMSLGSSRSSSGTRSSTRHSSSSSSSSSGKGCGAAIGTLLLAIVKFLQAILMVLVQILFLILLLGVAALFVYIAYKVTDATMDHYDEEVLVTV